MQEEASRFKIKLLWFSLCLSALFTAIKFLAWHLTQSNAVLTDALESIINVVAGIFALYSMYYASQPKDGDHPYGHGKIEFLSAGFEGGLIFIAGGLIIIHSIHSFFLPPDLAAIDKGLYLVGISGVCNFVLGSTLVRSGTKHNSVLLTASGKHLITDTISTAGVLAGLLIIYFTGMAWLDNLIAILYGGFILRTGSILLKSSITGLLDEADFEKLHLLVKILNTKRRAKWIDIHNLRIQKFGAQLHVDCHITLPWYDNLEESHSEVSAVENLIKEELSGEVEFFIHSDPCLPTSCPICTLQDCKVRQAAFVQKLEWTLENMLPDKKHTLPGKK